MYVSIYIHTYIHMSHKNLDKLPRSSHFYACFSMLEPKYVMGYCLPQLCEKAPELVRPPPQVTERLALDSFAPHASPPARDARVATIC